MSDERHLSTTASDEQAKISDPSAPLVHWLAVAAAPSPELVGHRMLANGLVVGRGTAPIFRDDRQLSRRHASFIEVDGELEVIDLDSHNGTWLRGARITKKRLAVGDYVRVGAFGFVVARAPALRRVRSDDVLAGDSHVFQRALAELEALAASTLPAIVWGPPGSGRSSFCERVHARSGREGALEWLDVRGIPEDALRASLLGAIERAAGGTLVIESVDAIATAARGVASAAIAAAERVPCRILATSTSEDALAGILPGSAWTVRMPPLAERRDDIVLLLDRLSRRLDAKLALTAEQVESLVTRAFPGNVTELATLVERAHRSAPELRDVLLGVTADRAAPDAPVVIARSGAWFSTGSTRVDLTASPVLASVLRALVKAHVSGQGWVGTDALVGDSWSGERILARAAKNRVYVAMSSLRRLGLRNVVVRGDAGYSLEGNFVLAE